MSEAPNFSTQTWKKTHERDQYTTSEPHKETYYFLAYRAHPYMRHDSFIHYLRMVAGMVSGALLL